ncbi:hypothetical protein SRHO_G00102500 [Serrasalmus rhombeus]
MPSQISSEVVLCRVYISSLQHATMRRRFDVSQVLDHIFDDNESEDTQQQSDTDEQISEEEDDVEYHPEDTDTSDQSDEEVTSAEAAPAPTETFKSKSGICWSSVPPDIHGRADAANGIRMTPGITSYDLGQELLKRNLTMVGTVKKNNPELPPEMLQVKDRAPLSSQFVFTDTTTAVSYCPKKRRNVILMSTLHKDAAVSSGSDKKPIIILDYNKNKGGVDNLDKLTATYTCQ